jgi:hypothetical protein
MKNTEINPIMGDFSLDVYRGGKLIYEIREKNLVVASGRQSVARLLGGSGANKQVTQISFGTNGTDAADGDSSITGEFKKALNLTTYPETNSVLFQFTLETGEANGMAIREFGLLSQDNTLFARRAREVINKTSDLRLEGTWKIIF